MTAQFCVLGGVTVRSGDSPIDVGPPRQQCVLAVLLLHAYRCVTVDRIIEAVWADHPPSRVRSSVYSYVANLRRALAPTDTTIVRSGNGYLLEAEPLSVDLHYFRSLIERAHNASDDNLAATVFDHALAVWRGEPFAGVDSSWLHGVRVALADEQFAAVVEANDVKLRLGRYGSVLATVAEHVRGHPWDERLAAQHMSALARIGRPAEALRVYHEFRQRMVDELGIEPSPRLREQQRRVLGGDIGHGPPQAGRDESAGGLVPAYHH